MRHTAKWIRLRLALTFFVLCAAAPPSGEVAYQVVHTQYYHGIPYQIAHGLGPEAVPTLLELLAKEEEREYWANIVNVLGMIGDDRATEPLIAFLEKRFTGEVDGDTYRALLEVPAALGLLARDPSSRAFAYLRDGTSLEVWQSKNLSWTAPSLRQEDRDVLMVRRSITGLGLSGTEAGRRHLRDVQQSYKDSGLQRVLQDNFAEALQMSERVESLGYERAFAEESQGEPKSDESRDGPKQQ